MESIRTVDLKELRARVASAEYVVDEEAVAEAIVRRALGGREERKPSRARLPYDVQSSSAAPRAV
jgi:hypothetical protein